MGLVGDVNAAFLARLRAHPMLSGIVYDTASRQKQGDEQPLPVPYVMVFADNGQHTSELLAEMAERSLFNYTLHLVADTGSQLDRMGDAVLQQVLNWRPEVPGYRFFKARHHFSTPDNTNNRLLPTPVYRVDEIGLRCVRGKAA